MTDQRNTSRPRDPDEKFMVTQEDVEVEAGQMLDLSGADPETHSSAPASS